MGFLDLGITILATPKTEVDRNTYDFFEMEHGVPTFEAFTCLTESDKHNLVTFLAPLVYMEDTDEFAKRFDNLMYGLMIAAIHKLRHNIPLTALDYKSLERIFTGELGTTEDYQREFKDTPFGLLVRKVAKMEYDAATAAFSEFINDQSLSQAQIVFVKKVIDYIVQNGYMENPAELMKPPFDKPQNLMKLFDGSKQKKILELVAKIRENAIKIVG